MSVLIVYYSRRGQNYCNGAIKNLVKGNTELAAQFIWQAVGGTLAEVKTVKEYPADYYACIDEAKAELRDKARPALKDMPENLDGYDTVFDGYPNWWGTTPMAMFTFLEGYNWQGKKIISFCTNEGSGMGSSERDIAAICRGATLLRGLSIHGAETARLKDKIMRWAKDSVK